MNILIRQARIVSPGHVMHNKTFDLLVEGGIITGIKKTINARANVKVIEGKNLRVSSGWIDLQAAACDPGYEHKEDLDSLVKSAAAGGFAAVCVHSYTQPALHNKSQIEYVINKTRNRVVDVLPFGTITVDAKGKDLAEMYDMKMSGARAFSDYKNPLKDAGILVRALQYSDNIGSLVIAHCNDHSISHGGQMNEGETSTMLGLKGMPALAEELMLQRNLAVLEYAGGRLHVPTISTRASLELIKKAKAAGLAVTCGVAASNLYLDDTVLSDFDTNYKLDPPLRTKKDVQALRNGIDAGLIDVIVSDHAPQDPESKELEFDHADFGMIGLQTAFSCALAGMGEKGIDGIINAFTTGPRAVLGLEPHVIEEGAAANLTLFSANAETTLNEGNNLSRSGNSPFMDKTLPGKVIGVINGSKSFFN